jgi:hypothetical protein
MYEVLGDAQALADIRLSHPKVEHCDKLEINPRACSGCALNPRKPEKLAKQERVEAGSVWINQGLELSQASRLGLLSTDMLDSTDQILLSSMRVHEDLQRDERQAILIANKMAEVLAALFGPKK